MRLRANFLTGTLNAQLANNGVTLSSVELSKMPVVSSPDYMPIALDPFGEFGAPEIAWVTDHASGSSQATLLRHQEGTLARVHNAPTIWANTLTAQDFNDLYTQVDAISGALPSYLPLAGGSMLGPLLLEADPLDPLGAATKAYVDSVTSSVPFLPLAGGTMTGHISQASNPTSASHLARKGYVDTKADDDHTHSGYAATSHGHSNYEPLGHGHGEYSVTSHGHPWGDISGEPSFSLSSHGHSGYLPINGGNLTGELTSSQGAHFNERIRSNASFYGTNYYPQNLWGYHGGSNGSLRWMGVDVAFQQNHTSSSVKEKVYVQDVDLEKAVFNRLRPIWFRYSKNHKYKDRWDDFDEAVNPPTGRMGFAYEDLIDDYPQWCYLADGMEAIGYEDMLPDFMAWTVAAIQNLMQRVAALEGI